MSSATLRRRLKDMEVRAATLRKQSGLRNATVSLRAFREYYVWSVDNPGKEYHDTALQRLVDDFFSKFNAEF